MRFELFIGGVCAAGIALAAAACGGSDSTVATTPTDSDGGDTNSSGGSSGGSSSGGSSSGGSSGGSSSGGSSGSTSSGGGLTSKEIAKGFVIIDGIANDEVIYRALDGTTLTLNAVPIAGGTPSKITDLAAGDRVVVRGAAVGIWKSVANNLGTFNVWTKAAGLKTGPASSFVGLFTATTDGARIAFSVAATGTTSRFAVVNTANVTGTTTFNTGDNAAAALSNTCRPDVGFVGTTFVGAYCTAGSASRARLVKVDATANVFDQIISNAGTAGIQPYWLANKNNTKVLVLGLADTDPAQDEILRVVTLADNTITGTIDRDVFDGVLTDDGTAVIYRTEAGALKRASTGATPAPVELVAAPGALQVVGYTTDKSRVLFSPSDPSAGPLVDLKTATTAAANTPVDIATAAQPLGPNPASTHWMYLTTSGQSATLKSKPVAGGAEKEIFKDPQIALVPPAGANVVVAHASKEIMLGNQPIDVFTLSAVDSAVGGTPQQIATDSPQGEWFFKDKTFVYSRLVVSGGVPGMGSGMFVTTLP